MKMLQLHKWREKIINETRRNKKCRGNVVENVFVMKNYK